MIACHDDRERNAVIMANANRKACTTDEANAFASRTTNRTTSALR